MGKELFNNIPSKVGDLINDVKSGRIGLPDLQRPFVWRDNKVRDLLDNAYETNRNILCFHMSFLHLDIKNRYYHFLW